MTECNCACFEITFSESEEFTIDFGEVVYIDHDYDPYTGDYNVIPKTYDQVLSTNGKNMTDDVTVYEIPYAEVSNTYGTTVTIAS